MTSGLGVLSSDPEAPVVTEATVGADLLETLEVLTKLVVEDVGHHLGGLAVLDVTLPVQEPVRDLVLTGVLKRRDRTDAIVTTRSHLDDGDQPLDLLLAQLSGPPVEGDVGLLQTDVGVTTSDTLDGGHGEHDAGLSIDVGVENTKNVLEVWRNNQRHLKDLSLLSERDRRSVSVL